MPVSRFTFLSIAFCVLNLVVQNVEAVSQHARQIASYRSGLDQPSDIVISEKEQLYILDGAQHRVVVLSAKGRRLFTFGKQGRGSGELHLPMAITIADDKVFIADTTNHRIAVFDKKGRFIENIALVNQQFPAQPPEPVGLSVKDDVISWSDRKNHSLCQTRLSTGTTMQCWGKRGEGDAEFQFPFHIAADRDGYLYVVDVLNGRIKAFNPKGRLYLKIAHFGIADGELYRPNGIAFADDGRMFISDSYLGKVSIFIDGRFSGYLSVDDDTARKFEAPVGLAWRNDKLYVVDVISNRVEVFKSGDDDKGILLEKKPGTGNIKTSRKNCDTCHYSWAVSSRSEQKDQDGVLPVASQKMCYSCHHGAVIDSRVSIGSGKQHPDIHHQRDPSRKTKTEEQDKVPAEFPLIGDDQLYCGSCHTPHTADIKESDTLYESHSNPWLRILNKEGDLCQQCHESKLDSVLDDQHPVRGINHPVGLYLQTPEPANDPERYARTESLQKGLPNELKLAGASVGSDQQLICQSCHQIHGASGEQLLPAGFDSNELCESCHQELHSKDKKQAHHKGIHPVDIEMEEAVELNGVKVKQVTCLVCHSAHSGRENSKLLTRTTADIEKLCASCHPRQHATNERDARKKGVHAVNMKLEEAVKIDGEEITAMTCLSCHSVHAGKPDTAVLREDDKNGELCSHCHKGNNAIVNSDHDLRITAEKSMNRFEQTAEQSGACGSCHSMHRGEGEAPFLFSGVISAYTENEKVFQRDQLCLDCHLEKCVADKMVVEHFSHPAKDLVLRSDPEVMPLLDDEEKISEFGAIACITCHEPHHWQAGEDSSRNPRLNPEEKNKQGNVLNSFLRLKDVKNTFCVDCHGIETQIKYKYYHDKLSRDIGVDYIH